MKFSNLIYWISFSLISIYIVLRAWFVTPLFDEAASYFHYILTGQIWGGDAILDANNHLLISYWGNFWFKNGFDSFFLFRLISIIGFIAYASAWHVLIIKKLKLEWGHFIVICSIAIPWIAEYGALARGYSFSIACWMWMIVLAIDLVKEWKTVKLILFFTLAWLTIFSSFTFTVPIFILIGFLFTHVILQSTTKKRVLFFLISILFVVAYLPLFQHSLSLKENGFLWWGSTEGLWKTTGSSITEVVLFSNTLFSRILLNLIAFISFITFVFVALKNQPSEWFKKPFIWITAYTISILTAVIFLAKGFNINYPKDRVGMYLVPLFLLLFIFIIEQSKKLKWGYLTLLFFPMTLLFHFNLSTTIFSPQDRITSKVYQKINNLVPQESQLTAEWMAYVLYNYQERIHHSPRIIFPKTDEYPLNSDFFLTTYSTIFPENEGYKLIYRDSATSVGLYQKEAKKEAHIFDQKQIPEFSFNEDYHTFFKIDSTNYKWTQTPFSYQIKGTIELSEPAKELFLFVAYSDSTGNTKYLQNTNFQNLFYPRTKFNFILHSPTFPPIKNAKDFSFYFMNLQLKEVKFKNLEVTLYRE